MTKARCWKHRAFSKSVRAYLSGPPFVEGLTQLRVPLQALDGRRNRETPVTTAIQTAILNTFRAGQISRTAKDVLLIIARSIRPASYESLAKAAKCSRRSVAYAIQQAEQLGILRRSHNRIRRGRRWMNGCNGYRFIMKALTETLAFPWSRSQCKPESVGLFLVLHCHQNGSFLPNFSRCKSHLPGIPVLLRKREEIVSGYANHGSFRHLHELGTSDRPCRQFRQ